MSSELPLIVCEGASRTYGRGSAAVVALSQTDCRVGPGQQIALVGPSGSGKSTLLYLLAGLDDPTTGSVSWPGIGAREDLRPSRLAMIFQSASLLPPLTVEENVAFPLLLAGHDDGSARSRARRALDALDLGDLAAKLPEEISGGQAQRVAVARALAGEPSVILADEPTGQLDVASAAAVVDALLSACRQSGASLLLSTHDPAIADHLGERWQMRNGELMQPSGQPA